MCSIRSFLRSIKMKCLFLYHSQSSSFSLSLQPDALISPGSLLLILLRDPSLSQLTLFKRFNSSCFFFSLSLISNLSHCFCFSYSDSSYVSSLTQALSQPSHPPEPKLYHPPKSWTDHGKKCLQQKISSRQRRCVKNLTGETTPMVKIYEHQKRTQQSSKSGKCLSEKSVTET